MIATSYLSNAGESITTTDQNREDSTGVILSGQMVSYLVPTDLQIISCVEMAYIRRSFEPMFIPEHKIKNPFERQIFNSILSKHDVCIKNTTKNVTFNRINMRGFFSWP